MLSESQLRKRAWWALLLSPVLMSYQVWELIAALALFAAFALPVCVLTATWLWLWDISGTTGASVGERRGWTIFTARQT